MDCLARKKYDLDHTVGIIAAQRSRCKGVVDLDRKFRAGVWRHRDRSNDREAAADEDVEIGSGEEVSPQLELDSADRFEVDTISSSGDAKPDRDDN